MKPASHLRWYVMLSLLISSRPLIAQPPSFAKQVKPFLAKYCLECHNAEDAKGGLVMDSFASLSKGGDNGPVLTPGKPDESRLVLMPEGKAKPPMPPKKAKQPKATEVAVLRAWVAAGAKDDSTTVAVRIPNIKPRVHTSPPVTALAYHPSGSILATGVYKEVVLIDTTTGDPIGPRTTLPGKVTALAFSGDGRELAVASSTPGTRGEVFLFSVRDRVLAPKPDRILPAHHDAILALAFHPDGRVLATTGYDRLIKLWNLTSGKELRTLKDHSDAVYGLAFNPDGRLLASAAADRAVKVWDVASGTRLYTLSEATDWLYGVSWSPDGRHVAAGGVDKSIRVWQVSAKEGKLVHSVFAHEGAVTRLLYATDGKTLYSVGEDNTPKAWDTGTMRERRVYPRQPEAVLGLAAAPDHKQLAIGRYDGTLLLVDEATAKILSEPLPFKPKPPQLTKLSPAAGPRGQTVRITFDGKYLDGASEVVSPHSGLRAKIVAAGKSDHSVQAEIIFPANMPAGTVKLGIQTPAGQTTQLPFIVDLFPSVAEVEPNDSPATGQKITLPVTVVGTIGQAGSVDYYRFDAQSGQEIGVHVLTNSIGSKLDAVMELIDERGRVVARCTKDVLGYKCDRTGTYALGIRDREYRGGPEMFYRLHLGNIPVITAVFPLGLQRGSEAEIHVRGVNLGVVQTVRVHASPEAALGSRLSLALDSPHGKPLGDAGVVVGEFAEVVHGGPHPRVPVPGTANGLLEHPGAVETWQFTARKGQRLIIETNARRLGSPLDSYLEVLDAAGKPVPRALLRCAAKTYVTFRDHDSATSGIRIENWSELGINDYVWVGNELLRILELPKNPDDDCQFFAIGKQRRTYLDTTPTFISQGVPMYKVAIHPPGTTFPANGFPVIALNYRNDDGGPGYGKDSRIFFDPPADGEYQVRVGDTRGQGGDAYAYRLTVRPPRPSFAISFKPTAPAVWKGGAIPVTVSAERADGFEGQIDVHIENLPRGFSAPVTAIPVGENSTTFALSADSDVPVEAKPGPFKVVARARIGGEEVVREVTGTAPKTLEPGDLVTTTEQGEVTLKPGGQVRMTARIERHNGFKGRVPLEVRGLPHGVRVLDIGLNGILITENEDSRTFVIYAEPWVEPTNHPFVVLAKSERKGTEHAAKSVLLKVQPGSSQH